MAGFIWLRIWTGDGLLLLFLSLSILRIYYWMQACALHEWNILTVSDPLINTTTKELFHKQKRSCCVPLRDDSLEGIWDFQLIWEEMKDWSKHNGNLRVSPDLGAFCTDRTLVSSSLSLFAEIKGPPPRHKEALQDVSKSISLFYNRSIF